jgi:hypothetical protein
MRLHQIVRNRPVREARNNELNNLIEESKNHPMNALIPGQRINPTNSNRNAITNDNAN